VSLSLLSERLQPPAQPSGWYAVAFSSELPPGAVLVRPLFGADVVVFRTASGRAAVSAAHCPHLGAHLGHGGRVVGETLRCPFHGFRFDTTGECAEAYPGKRVPPTCRLPVWPVRERNGQVLVYFHPAGRAPDWEVPELDARGYRTLVHESRSLAGHPQETSENSVDIGHFAVVHGYDQVRALSAMEAEGPLLRGHYAMRRKRGPLSPAVNTEFRIAVWGLGYSVVEAHVRELGLAFRHFVLATPTRPGELTLRLAVSMRSFAPGLARRSVAGLPLRAAESLVERFAMRAFTADVLQDFPIWQTKTFVERPALAEGDGPIALYRKWVRQFYS
jgi:nitrite reductase/ring-hydroxylating ferredoxin subunit